MFVNNLAEKTITSVVDRNDNIANAKQKIENQEGIHPEHQRPIFVCKQLADNCCLSYYNMQKESILHLVLRLRGGITQIYVVFNTFLFFQCWYCGQTTSFFWLCFNTCAKMLTGQTIILDVDTNDPIGNVKQKTWDKERIPPDTTQINIFVGKQ